MTAFYDAALMSIDVAIATIDSVTDNTKFSEVRVELFSSIINAVHTISDYYERIIDCKLSFEDDDVFRAFAYVNNQIKHDKELEFFYSEIAGSMFPLFFPFQFGAPGLYWKDFKDNGRIKARAKREHYVKHLMGKEIKDTLLQMKNRIIRVANN